MSQDKYTTQELLEARERNNSRKFKNDTIWESTQCGSFSILGKFDSTHLYIQFLNTGAIYVRNSSSISSVLRGKSKTAGGFTFRIKDK